MSDPREFEGRWERAIRAFQASKLTGADFIDWVQRSCDDLVDGFEAECPHCETAVHDGPCVEGTGPLPVAAEAALEITQ